MTQQQQPSRCQHFKFMQITDSFMVSHNLFFTLTITRSETWQCHSIKLNIKPQETVSYDTKKSKVSTHLWLAETPTFIPPIGLRTKNYPKSGGEETKCVWMEQQWERGRGWEWERAKERDRERERERERETDMAEMKSKLDGTTRGWQTP